MNEATLTSDINPYSAPDASLDSGHDEEYYQPKLFSFSGRIGRLRYLAYNTGANLLLLGALILMSGGIAGLAAVPEMSSAFRLFYIASNLLLFVIAIIWGKRRLNDLNRTGWWMLLLIVPLVNFIFIIYLIGFGGSEASNNYGPPPVANSLGIKILGSLLAAMFALAIIGILAAIVIPMMAG
jgi:uncharacterized membrane protein YhaH (DUF805 family)